MRIIKIPTSEIYCEDGNEIIGCQEGMQIVIKRSELLKCDNLTEGDGGEVLTWVALERGRMYKTKAQRNCT